ncbi:MAG: sterol desaturase family protein [Bdellovibrionales bacterium]|nr:sterol desaturase family protein [Bdellovibrionales bacterium]
MFELPGPDFIVENWHHIFITYIVPIEVALVLIEEVSHFYLKKINFKTLLKEAFLYTGISLISRGVYYLYIMFIFGPLVRFFKDIQFFSFHSNSIFYWVACFIVLDCCSYWVHRLEHHNKYMWSLHDCHHSSERFHLLLRIRGNNLKPLNNIPYKLIFILFGMHPVVIEVCTRVNKTYQFIPHFSYLINLGPFEHILQTPRNHIVHHAYNGKYLNKNFGATFIIWDKLFGTYQKYDPEYELKIGTLSGSPGYNPFYVYFRGIIELFTPKNNKKEFKKVA